MMKKIHFLLLISLLLAACSDDDKEKQPAFVTNITISDAGKTFNPGDAVTVKADGLQSGDQIILDIYWPIADNPLFPEGYSRYTRAVTTEQTTNSITFLAPGHWPASRVEMFLERAGQLQPLGQISVADGQSPEEPYLYGITNSHAIYTPTVPVQRSFGEKLSSAFSDGWRSFVRGLQYFCIDLASMLPGLVLFVLLKRSKALDKLNIQW